MKDRILVVVLGGGGVTNEKKYRAANIGLETRRMSLYCRKNSLIYHIFKVRDKKTIIGLDNRKKIFICQWRAES